jgi:hypothetical protein
VINGSHIDSLSDSWERLFSPMFLDSSFLSTTGNDGDTGFEIREIIIPCANKRQDSVIYQAFLSHYALKIGQVVANGLD